jgi:ribonuclease P protein component
MQTFKKEERLCSKKIIGELFSEGYTFYKYPFLVKWSINDNPADLKATLLINVSKKHHKRSVDRNLIKRRIREAYRKNKNILYDYLNENNINLVFSLIYNSKEIALYKEIELKIILILQRFQKEYEKTVR